MYRKHSSYMGFNRFHVSRSLGSPGIDFWSHFGRSLLTLGSLLVVFEGVDMSSEIRRNFEDPLGDPRLRAYTQCRVKCLSRAAYSKPTCS